MRFLRASFLLQFNLFFFVFPLHFLLSIIIIFIQFYSKQYHTKSPSDVILQFRHPFCRTLMILKNKKSQNSPSVKKKYLTPYKNLKIQHYLQKSFLSWIAFAQNAVNFSPSHKSWAWSFHQESIQESSKKATCGHVDAIRRGIWDQWFIVKGKSVAR